MGRGSTRERKARGLAAGLGVALLALALAGCGGLDIPMEPAMPADMGPDPAISESSTQADAVMTCDGIANERAGIAQSLSELGQSPDAAALRRRDAELARLAALKRCSS
jgi:hypothetical protein